jgi:hypothetical protein
VNRTVIQAVSDKNKISRALVKTSHTAGTKSYARWAEDLVSNLYLMHLILIGQSLADYI